MRRTRTSEMLLKESPAYEDISWENVQSQFSELTTAFNESFPHLPTPKIIFEQSGASFHIKLHIFDTLIELARSHRNQCVALLTVIELAKRIVEENASELSNEETQPAGETNFVNSIRGKRRKKQKRSKDLLNAEELAELGIGAHSNQTYLSEHNIIGKSADGEFQPQNLKNQETKEIKKEEESVEKDFSLLVKEHCKIYKLCYPEYMFEKTNGLFICKAEFDNEEFTSKYAYKKEDAKEEVSKMVHEFIQERNAKKGAKIQSEDEENNCMKIDASKIYEESDESDPKIQNHSFVEDEQINKRICLENIQGMFKKEKKGKYKRDKY